MRSGKDAGAGARHLVCGALSAGEGEAGFEGVVIRSNLALGFEGDLPCCAV